MNTKKHILIVLTILFIGLLIVGGTYAFWTWNSSTSKNVIFNTSDNLKNYIVYDEGNSKFSGNFEASNSFNQGMNSTISIYKKNEAANVSLTATIHMKINTIGENLSLSSALKWVVTEGNSSNPGSILASGDFIGLSNGDELILVPNIEVTTTNHYYTVWIWLDSSESPSSNLTGETLDTTIWTEINQTEGMEDNFEITKLSSYYQNISATVINNKYKVTNYGITTAEVEPSTWENISSSEQNNIYNFNYSVSSTGTYYIWFKDNHGSIIHESITINEFDNSPPVCSFGSFSNGTISNNENSTITLTCTDTETGIDSTNLKASLITVNGNAINIHNVTKESITNGYTYTITVRGTSNDGDATFTIGNNLIHNNAGVGNTSVTSPTITVVNPYVATFYYNSNNTSGGLTVATASASCMPEEAGSSCMVTIPSSVTNSVGKYNSEYKGISKNLSSMTATRGTTSISGNTTYYAYYSSPITVYYPDTSNGVSSSNTDLYRNEYFTSTSEMNTVIALSGDSTEQTDSINIEGMTGSFNGITPSANNSTGSGIDNNNIVNSDTTTYYATTVLSPYTVTFYYNSNNTSGETTISTTSVTGGRVSYCTSNSETNVISESVEIPSVVRSSVGTYNNSYFGLSETIGNMTASVSASATEISPGSDKTYYAIYSSPVTNYYVSDSESNDTYTFTRTSRSLYRNQWFNSTSSLSDSVLATNNSGKNNYNPTPNTLFGSFSGFNTNDNTTITYSSVSLAANSSSDTLYTIYNLSVNLVKGDNVSSIGDSFASCLTTNTSCILSLPSITPEPGYTSIGWYDTPSTTILNNTNTYNLDNSSISTSGENGKLYANVVRIETEYELSTNIVSASITNFTNVTSYAWRVSTNSVCDDNNLTTTSSNTYTFNVSQQDTYYVCLKLTDNENRVTYLSREVPKMVFMKNTASSNEFKSNTYMNKIISLDFRNIVNTSNSVVSWDLSESNDNSIIGWLTRNTTNSNFYDLHIGSNYEIYGRNMFSEFANFASIEKINMTYFHANKTENMSQMFFNSGCNRSSLMTSSNCNFELNLGNSFDASSATNMSQMFANTGASNLWTFRLNLGNNFNASNAIDMSKMFAATYAMSIDLGNNFNASNATNLDNMFMYSGYSGYSASTRGILDNFHISLGNNFNATNLKSVNYMFSYLCRGLGMEAGAICNNIIIDFGNNFNAHNLENMPYMFNLIEKNLVGYKVDFGNNFNLSNATTLNNMFFFNINNVRLGNFTVDFGNNFNATNILYANNVFANAGSYTTNIVFGDNFNMSRITSLSNFLSKIHTTNRAYVDFGNNFNSINVMDMSNMFHDFGSNATTIINFGNGFYTTNVTNMASMFKNASGGSVSSFNLNLGNNFNTSKVTDMNYMFHEMGKKLNSGSLNLGDNFDTSNVVTMTSMFENMFQNVNNFYLNLNNKFDIGNVTSLNNLFANTGCESSDYYLHLGDNFNASRLTTIESTSFIPGQFYSCNIINYSLNLGNNFNAVNVENMGMFSTKDMKGAVYVDLGNNFNVSKLKKAGSMFRTFASSATSVNITFGENFGGENITSISFMFENFARNATDVKISFGNNFNLVNVTDTSNAFRNFALNTENTIYIDLSKMPIPTTYSNMFYKVPTSKTVIYVSNTTTRDWILNNSSMLGATFSASNVLIK